MKVSILHLTPTDEHLLRRSNPYIKALVTSKSVVVRIIVKDSSKKLRELGFSKQFIEILQKAKKTGDTLIFCEGGRLFEKFRQWS